MSNKGSILYWLVYAVIMAAAELAIVVWDSAAIGYWLSDVLEFLLLARAAPVMLWVVLAPATWLARSLVVAATALLSAHVTMTVINGEIVWRAKDPR